MLRSAQARGPQFAKFSHLAHPWFPFPVIFTYVHAGTVVAVYVLSRFGMLVCTPEKEGHDFDMSR